MSGPGRHRAACAGPAKKTAVSESTEKGRRVQTQEVRPSVRAWEATAKPGVLTLIELATPETRVKGWQEAGGQGGLREAAHGSGFEGEGEE